jgi:putative alpha-1,2-mannosidase
MDASWGPEPSPIALTIDSKHAPVSQYELVSPVFDSVVIRLQAPYSGNKFTIQASENPGTTPYIQSVKLNGQDHSQNWITFGDMTAGGELQFALGAEPDKSWGSTAQDAPPSLSKTEP